MYENHEAELYKLRQTSSVTDYQAQFEKLCNRNYGLSPTNILNCFISSLSPAIKRELALHKPASITQAIGLAKLVESKILDSKLKFSKQLNPYSTSPTQLTQSSSTTNSTPSHPLNTPSLPVKHLSQAQQQERRAVGLCYYCDAKFHSGHKCSPPKFLILLAEAEFDEKTTPTNLNIDPDIDLEAIHLQLSSQALMGFPSPQALKFQVNLFPSWPVGNGQHISCFGLCSNVPITFQNHLFHIPCYLLPIQGVDVILGIEWLRSIGPIQADFSIPQLSFSIDKLPITIQDDPSISPTLASYQQICHLIHHDSIASYHFFSFDKLTTHIEDDNSIFSPHLERLT
uniref:Retrotransposon gag domain-containing protein n=1 Tax=Cajanus cajan TaxID=3821 RepID=A0A151QLP4_CAJCA|nr:hypothetical protein KK1_048663 [Cajanus cajan]